MKKLFCLLLAIPFLFVTTSCEDELDRLWNNPNIYIPATDEVVPGLFCNMQKKRFWQRDYGEWYWFVGSFGSWMELSQLSGLWPYGNENYINRWADGEYGNVDRFVSSCNNNTHNRFSRFYTDLNNYGLIRDEVKAASGDAYTNTVVYFKLATFLKNIVALQTVDLFNSIPYFNAFKGSEGIFFVSYDDPMEIYKSVIAENAEIATEIKGLYAAMSEGAKNAMSKQDIYFGGDMDKWIQFINQEILRSCVRLSGVNAEYAKPYLAEAIKNLPTEDFTFQCTQLNQASITGAGNGGIFQRGYYENWLQLTIPDVIMTRMNRNKDLFEPEVDDPRLPVIAFGYSPSGKADSVEYFGLSQNYERNRYLGFKQAVRKRNVVVTDAGAYWAASPSFPMDLLVKSCPWTCYNPLTFLMTEMPLYLASRAERDLLLSEVALKGLASTGKTAGQHIHDAVVNSTDFWYMLNHVTPNYVGSMSDNTKKIVNPDKPSSTIINTYANTIKSEFEGASGEEGKMEILMQQKYIHLNVLSPFECFAELRRTRHPKLEPVTCKGASFEITNATMMLERFKLPASERSTNYDEYIKVMEYDKWDSPIFWVSESKRNEPYFMSTAIKPAIP